MLVTNVRQTIHSGCSLSLGVMWTPLLGVHMVLNSGTGCVLEHVGILPNMDN